MAKELIIVKSLEDVINLLPRLKIEKFMFLGGGSNVLFIDDFDGLVVVNQIKGLEAKPINENDFYVSSMSGESWHEFVLWTLDKGYNGLENLSLIPGTVGAAPMQNIGAYGVEFKDVCIQVDALELSTGKLRKFNKMECEFGYRESVFKRALKDKYFIYQVHVKLSHNSPIKASYGNIQDVLKAKGIEHPNHRDISNAVIEIRSSKLPDPAKLGNAGSFFKNPVVEKSQANVLLQEFPNAPHFPDGDRVKIPAGWLIEQCGFKGYREGNTGSHKDQALVIVNYGNASGREIYEYSEKVIDAVKKRFNFVLEREVNMIG
ncbi:MAG: UDP-N-acetylmuramate dehydrogenase [Chitinophagales bacterium]|nr:UDP-N-acetylmuramate dehydrogenase [Chitinophagales bacterium]